MTMGLIRVSFLRFSIVLVKEVGHNINKQETGLHPSDRVEHEWLEKSIHRLNQNFLGIFWARKQGNSESN